MPFEAITPDQILTKTQGPSGTVPLNGERVLVASSPHSGMKNMVINGNFDIWQRATSFSTPASGAYTADMWKILYDGTIGTFTIQQGVFALGQTDVPQEPFYFFRWNQSAAGSGSNFRSIVQPIEGTRALAGRLVTVSFWARANAPFLVYMNLGQVFGSGGSPSTAVSVGPALQANLSTQWQKFTQTIGMPSILGKTLGSNGDDYSGITFNLPINTTMIIDIAQVQVEFGPTDTCFEILPSFKTLGICQRYYEELPALALDFEDHASSVGDVVTHDVGFRVPKRAVPSITDPTWSLTQSNTPVIVCNTKNALAFYATATLAGGSHNATSITVTKIDASL